MVDPFFREDANQHLPFARQRRALPYLALLEELKAELIQELRVELMALHLDDDQIITEEEAATLLGISPKTLYRMRVAGDLPCGYIGNKPRYSLGQIRTIMRRIIKDRR